MALKNGRTTAALQQILIGSVIPSGTIAPFAGGTIPEGWLLCDGSAISRTTYSALFSAVGVAHGSGDGALTFNLPDYQGSFLRGKVSISTVTGSGTVSTNNATFSSHGIKRTGFKVRLSSGTLTGLSTATDYYVIVVDTNTLAFSSSLANAIAGTKLPISGTNSAIIVQYEDPDYASRSAATVGGNSGGNLGSLQQPQSDSIKDFVSTLKGNIGGLNGTALIPEDGAYSSEYHTGRSDGAGSYWIKMRSHNRESRPKNSLTNYIIKV